jgi:hypothetical protein
MGGELETPLGIEVAVVAKVGAAEIVDRHVYI